MKKEEVKKIQEKAQKLLQKANIIITEEERKNIEVADFGLGDIEHLGLQVITYVSTERYCAKELVLFPRQTCAEHRHPPVDRGNPGKQETFRCRWGEVFLYVGGESTSNPQAVISGKYKEFFTVWKEVVLHPGDQYTLQPNTLHWFQAGDRGAVVSEFSSTNIDELDLWTDPNIKRIPTIE